MTDYRRATCSSCPATIIWAVTTGGKLMPVDAEPNPDRGNVELVLLPAGQRHPTAVVHGQPPLMAEHPLHLSHFATCPNAEDHRRGR